MKNYYRDKILRISLVSLFLTAVISGCGKKEENKSSETAGGAVPVKVAKVRKTDISAKLRFTGDIHGEKEINVYVKVPGKLANKLKREGTLVGKNEVIALIDRDEPALNYSKAEVRAPISGVITLYFAEPGDAVLPAPGGPVCTIADMDRVKVFIYVSGKDIGKVRQGQKAVALMDAYPGKVFEGIVSNVSAAADPQTRKIRAEITVPNPGHLLKPGTFARVEVTTSRREEVLAVPNSALLEENGKKFVFTVEAGAAKRNFVETGIKNEDMTVVVSGLEEGAPVVIEGNWGLSEGKKVSVTED
ncbi:MAG: efflux RND transporter periplasmic adaptor subunit [bacterium]